MYRLFVSCLLSLIVLVYAPAAADASQIARLGAMFTPNRLGASTTITVTVNISSPSGAAPSPLTDIDVHMPAGMGLAATTLGTATCSAIVLLHSGPGGCPPNAVMGYGRAVVEIPLSPAPIYETASLATVMGPSIDNQTIMLFYAQGQSPVSAELVFEDKLIGDFGPFGEQINTIIPKVPTFPGGPDVAVVHLQTSIGPGHLVYYRRVGGKLVPYRPVGMEIPSTCRRGGFPFRADLSFADGTHISSTTAVPCPRQTDAKRPRAS